MSSFRGMTECPITCYKARRGDQLLTSQEGGYKAGVP